MIIKNIIIEDAAVRKQAVSTIVQIYENPDNIPPMVNFLERFKSRLLEMSKDIDNSVSAASINLSCQMLKYIVCFVFVVCAKFFFSFFFLQK